MFSHMTVVGRWWAHSWVGGGSVVDQWWVDGSVMGRWWAGRCVGGGQSVDRVLTGDPASVCTTEKKDRQYTLLPFIGSQRVIRPYGMRCHLRGMDTPKLNAFSRMTMPCHGSTSSAQHSSPFRGARCIWRLTQSPLRFGQVTPFEAHGMPPK